MPFAATAYICKGGSRGEQMKTKTMYVPVAAGQRYHIGHGYLLRRSTSFLYHYQLQFIFNNSNTDFRYIYASKISAVVICLNKQICLDKNILDISYKFITSITLVCGNFLQNFTISKFNVSMSKLYFYVLLFLSET